MNESKLITPKKTNNNIKLSKGAINYLDNQFIKNGDNKVINKQFTFQVIYAIKKLSNWYCCSLLDQDNKFGGFCIQYESQYGEPKKGDIIQTNKIQIIKLPNRDTNLYFCENVKKLKESKKMVIDPKKVNSITKIRTSSKKNLKKNYELLDNFKINNNINNISNRNSPSHRLNYSNSIKNINNDSKNKNDSQKKYTFISDLTNFTNNPIFLLKCKFKSTLKEIISKNSDWEGKVQNYIFIDIKGDEIQGVAFNECAIKYDNIINIGHCYEISKVERRNNNPNFNITKCSTTLLFQNYSKIEKIEDNGEFDNVKNNTEFIKIKNLTLDKINSIVNVIGIILEDKGITEKRKENGQIVQIRRLCIGDDTLHKIYLKLWEEKIQKEKNYSKGDIVIIYYVKFKPYINSYEINSFSLTEILTCNDEQKLKELKDFYKVHPNVNEYKDMNYILLNSQQNIKFKFLYNFVDDYILEYNESNNSQLIKINGTVINFLHRESNYYEGCIFCNKKFENICPACLTDKKKLVFIFNVQIIDCSDYLWIEFFGEIAENFIGISVEDYQKLIKINDIIKLKEINNRILYHKYSFIGKYKGPSFDECHAGVFSVIQYSQSDSNYYKEIILELKK